MSRRAAAALLLCAVLAAIASVAAAHGRSTALTATGVRAGLHPAFLRTVVDFTGGTIEINDVNAGDPNPFDGTARLELRSPGVRATAAPLSALGIGVTVARGGPGLLVIRVTAAPRRFKYMSYFALGSPTRLAIDLWYARPSVAARHGRSGCLTLTSYAVGPTTVTAEGTERDLFEHSFVLRLRGARGGLIRQKPVTADGPWSARMSYSAPRQRGTLEVVALSAKDGTLDCLVQVPVRLGA
jgi:Immunoglobulin-like domain of bacterial spore germination